MSTDQKIVAVTGASGYVAAEVVYQLLEKGYTVHGTVRNKSKSQDLVEAFSVDGKPNPRLVIFEADLLKEGSFDEAFKGVDYVLHTASPVIVQSENPQKEIVGPALNGTKNVLASVEKFDTIKQIVITSSVVAIMNSTEDPNYICDEKDWNNQTSVESSPYPHSKVLAEKAAWDWYKGKENKIKLSIINPSFVLGRVHFKRTESFGINLVRSLISGDFHENGAPGALNYSIVNIRDVADAHIKSFELGKTGRFIVSTRDPVPLLELSEYLKKDFPNNPLPTKYQGELSKDNFKFTSDRANKELGIKITGPEDSIREMGQSLVKFDLVKKL